MWAAFANAKATHIFAAKILVYLPYIIIKVLTIHLTYVIFSFEQQGPGCLVFVYYIMTVFLIVNQLYLAVLAWEISMILTGTYKVGSKFNIRMHLRM